MQEKFKLTNIGKNSDLVNKIAKNKSISIQPKKLQIIAKIFRFCFPPCPQMTTPRQTLNEKWFKIGLMDEASSAFDGAKILAKRMGESPTREPRASPRVPGLRIQPSSNRVNDLLRDSRRTPAELELMMSPALPASPLAAPLGLLVVPLVLLVVPL